MKKKIKELTDWDYYGKVERGGLRIRNLPEANSENMEMLVDKVNELTIVVNLLMERLGMVEKDEEGESWG